MKIYFAGSIRAGRDDVNLYLQIINFLKTYGVVLTEHVGDTNVDIFGEEESDDKYIYSRDMSWLNSADIVVAEVTQPSLGVGYEIGKAVEKKKKILCLYQPQKGRKLSAMINGNPNLEVVNYHSLDQAKQCISHYVENKMG